MTPEQRALQVMIDDGAWEGDPPEQLLGGVAVSPGDEGVAIYGDQYGGMVVMSWEILRKLENYLYGWHRAETKSN